MSLSLGVHTVASASASVVTSAGINTAASGNGFVALFWWSSGVAFTSLVDSRSQTWVQIGSETLDATFGGRFRAYYVPNNAGGTGQTVTLTVSATGTLTIYVFEVTTTNGAGILIDQNTAFNLQKASPFVSPSMTTTVANDFIVGIAADNESASATYTAGSGYTLINVEQNTSFWTGMCEWKIGASITSYTADYTNANVTTSDIGILSFSEAAAGGATPFGSHIRPRTRPSNRRFKRSTQGDITLTIVVTVPSHLYTTMGVGK